MFLPQMFSHIPIVLYIQELQHNKYKHDSMNNNHQKNHLNRSNRYKSKYVVTLNIKAFLGNKQKEYDNLLNICYHDYRGF